MDVSVDVSSSRPFFVKNLNPLLSVPDMAKQSTQTDRNFDGLAARFKKNIYGGLKGDIRLAVLHRDFDQQLPGIRTLLKPGDKPLRILDAGGGQGQFSLAFAEAGHQVVICDISSEMLAVAAETVAEKQLQDRVQLVQSPLQSLGEHLTDTQFDLVFCHAVMEWMAEPQSLLPCLDAYIKPDGVLSLTFYNIHAMAYKNLLRGNLKKVMDGDFTASRGSLTPISAIEPLMVEEWIRQNHYQQLTKSGIRVFHDYILDPEIRNRDPETLLALELQLSQQEPYLHLGRYIHVLMRKP